MLFRKCSVFSLRVAELLFLLHDFIKVYLEVTSLIELCRVQLKVVQLKSMMSHSDLVGKLCLSQYNKYWIQIVGAKVNNFVFFSHRKRLWLGSLIL